MATGLEQNSKRRLQLIREAQPGVYDPAGKRTQMVSIKGELKPDSQFASFRPAGYNVDAWNALVRTHSVYAGTISYDYGQFDVIGEMLCGLPTITAPEVGVEELVFELPEGGERDIVTFTLEDGTLASCDRCTYAFIVSITMNSERMGNEVTGQITILCRKPEAEGVPMTGAVAQNEEQTIATGAGYTGVPIAIAARNGGVAQTLTPGTDNATAIGTKLELAWNITAGHLTVTGTSVAAAGPTPASANVLVKFTGASVTNTPQTKFVSSTPGVTVTRTKGGSDGVVVMPSLNPILPQNMTARRADTLNDLMAAVNLKGVRMIGLEINNLAEAIWFADDENETTFNAHVDKDDQTQMFSVELATRLVNGVNPDAVDLKAKSKTQPATPGWFDGRHKHPVTVHQFDVQMYASSNAVAEITSGNNVRALRFPMSAVIAPTRKPIRFILRRPSA